MIMIHLHFVFHPSGPSETNAAVKTRSGPGSSVAFIWNIVILLLSFFAYLVVIMPSQTFGYVCASHIVCALNML